MTYSIIEVQGKQFKVVPGQTIIVDRLEQEVGDTVEINQVLLKVDGEDIQVGTPYLEKVSLSAKIVEHLRGEKIRVATYKSKSRYRRVKGHRQEQTKLEIVNNTAKLKTEPKSKTKSKGETSKAAEKKAKAPAKKKSTSKTSETK